VLKRAFGEAWASIGCTVAPDGIDNVRISLAHATVAHAGRGEIGCDGLKIAAFSRSQSGRLQNGAIDFCDQGRTACELHLGKRGNFLARLRDVQ
jgi:hypothetical protein